MCAGVQTAVANKHKLQVLSHKTDGHRSSFDTERTVALRPYPPQWKGIPCKYLVLTHHSSGM